MLTDATRFSQALSLPDSFPLQSLTAGISILLPALRADALRAYQALFA
jgi:hypothetical protein